MASRLFKLDRYTKMNLGAQSSSGTLRILSLDGGGSKGFYTLGVLREIEALAGCKLCDAFGLIYGTSTGSIIASLLALGHDVEEIRQLYLRYVPEIMRARGAAAKTAALTTLADQVFGDRMFDHAKTGIGVVATKWIAERPMIFKGSIEQSHGRKSSFVPGFGVGFGRAVQASCSAYPFFQKTTVTTSTGDAIELMDGGYCANNPTLYAIADGIRSMGFSSESLRVVSIGVGVYPSPKQKFFMRLANKYLVSLQLLQKTLEVNTQSMEQLRSILYGGVHTVRINDTFERPEMACDFLEHDLKKLNLLTQRGSESFATREPEIRTCLFK